MEIIRTLSPLTWSFLAVISVLALYFHGPGYKSYTLKVAPTLLTSLGIFGTFFGVALGLFQFETDSVQESVPALLDGLKTAFWSSIAGLFAALSLKLRQLFSLSRLGSDSQAYQQATLDDVANLLMDIRQQLTVGQDSSLAVQLEKGHGQLQQGLSDINTTMKNYQQEMVQANTDALIAAIEHVMNDFNAKINAQYGQNFKELNASVGKMVTWIEKYRSQLETLIHQESEAAKHLSKITESYTITVKHAQSYTETAQQLGRLLNQLEQQTNKMEQGLSQLSSVAGEALKGLPSLHQNILALTETAHQSVVNNQQVLTEGVMVANQTMTQAVEQLAENIQQNISTNNEQLRSQINHAMQRTEQQVTKLDEALEAELEKSLKTFGYQLTALSEKFVKDYTPLTEKLRQLVALIEETERAA